MRLPARACFHTASAASFQFTECNVMQLQQPLQKLLKDFEAKNDQNLRTAKTKQAEWAAKEVDLKKNIQLLQANLDKAEQIRQQTLGEHQESTKNLNDAHVKEVCNPHL